MIVVLLILIVCMVCSNLQAQQVVSNVVKSGNGVTIIQGLASIDTSVAMTTAKANASFLYTMNKIKADSIIFAAQAGRFNLFNKAGLVSAISKRFTDTFSITSATPTINLAPYLSAMGCSNFSINAVTGFRAGANATTAPNVAVSAITGNSVSLVFSQTNTATVSVVGVSVLAGLPSILTPDPGNVKAIISFDAW